jgi:hypothetical protein
VRTAPKDIEGTLGLSPGLLTEKCRDASRCTRSTLTPPLPHAGLGGMWAHLLRRGDGGRFLCGRGSARPNLQGVIQGPAGEGLRRALDHLSGDTAVRGRTAVAWCNDCALRFDHVPCLDAATLAIQAIGRKQAV